MAEPSQTEAMSSSLNLALQTTIPTSEVSSNNQSQIDESSSVRSSSSLPVVAEALPSSVQTSSSSSASSPSPSQVTLEIENVADMASSVRLISRDERLYRALN